MKNVKVELLKDHYHDGREFLKGAVITVPEDIAQWMFTFKRKEGEGAAAKEIDEPIAKLAPETKTAAKAGPSATATRETSAAAKN